MCRSQKSTYVREYPLAQIQKQGGPSGNSFPSLGTVNWFANIYHLAQLSLCQNIWIFPFLPHQIQIWTYNFVALLTCVIRPVYACIVFLVSFFPILLLLHLSQAFVFISPSSKRAQSLKARVLQQRLCFIHLLWQLKCSKLFIIHNVSCATDYCCTAAKCKEIVIRDIKWYKILLQHCFCSVLDQKWLKGSHFGCKLNSI